MCPALWLTQNILGRPLAFSNSLLETIPSSRMHNLQMSVKTSVLRKKTHDIESASVALLLLGFKEEVRAQHTQRAQRSRQTLPIPCISSSNITC